MSSSLSVSVALCTFNGSAFIEEQLVSVLEQSEPPAEIVVSDDSSNDSTLAVVSRVFGDWRTRHPGVPLELKILRNPVGLGVVANFEQALGACTGDLLALCDQDDRWHPRRLERMAREFERRPSLTLLHSDARLIDGDGQPLGLTLFQTLGVTDAVKRVEHGGRAFELLLRRNIVTGATTMLRRALFERSRPFPDAWVHDEWLAMTAAIGGGVDVLDEELVDYRQHGGNQIGVTTLDINGRAGRLRAPRTLRNERLLARAEALAERAPLLVPEPAPDVIRAVTEKRAHEQARSMLPAARMLRGVPVLREWCTGRYSRFGRGAQDVLRDLVQPV
ncbi:glycosyltransferase family 2 protein [Cryobacterium sp. 5B3]|nr:glycosyltransferase family 2 protein [Cryobacterium sp. 5B3]